MPRPGVRPVSPPGAGFLLLAPVAMLLAVLPVLASPVLPLLDVHSHQTRLYALWSILVAGTGSRFYTLDTVLLPNMGFDFAGLVLARWMDVATAGRVFFAAVLLLTLGGVAALGRVLSGRWSPVTLAAVLLLFNLFTVLGFLSYALGIALLFWALAARLALDGRPAWVRLAAGGATGAVLLVCHVAAFATYAVVLAGMGLHLLTARWGGSIRLGLVRLGLTALEGLPAIVLFSLMDRGSEGGFEYHLPFWRSKLLGLAAAVSGGSLVADIAAAAGLAALAILLAGRARFARPAVPGLVMLGMLYFAVPPHVGAGSFVDARIPAVVLLLAIAAVDIGHWAPRPVLVLAVVVGLACGVKQAALAVLWHGAAVPLAAVAALLDRLPDGAVILQAECAPRETGLAAFYAGKQPPLGHAIAMAGLDGRRFVPITWTIPGQQAIRAVPDYVPYKALQDRFSQPVCTGAEAETMLSAARALLAQQAGTGRLVAPLFLSLIRLDPGAVPTAPLVGRAADLAIYAVAEP